VFESLDDSLPSRMPQAEAQWVRAPGALPPEGVAWYVVAVCALGLLYDLMFTSVTRWIALVTDLK
jgi:hypothetical protein